MVMVGMTRRSRLILVAVSGSCVPDESSSE